VVRCIVQKSRPSSNVNVKGQGHQGQKNALSAAANPPSAYEWYAIAANSVQQERTGPFRGCQGVFSGACVRCMSAESSLALVSKQLMQLCRPLVLRRWENHRMLSSLPITLPCEVAVLIVGGRNGM